MRAIRIYCPNELQPGAIVALDDNGVSHVNVLRLKKGDVITVFNGNGAEFAAILQEIHRQHASVKILEFISTEVESPLKIHLGQVISRGDKMDHTIQKAVELGVSEITPLFSQRCGVKLDKARLQKKVEHWQGIIISACEQSGRNQVPLLHEPVQIGDWLTRQSELSLLLSPYATTGLAALHQQYPHIKSITLLIGPEGGFTEMEVMLAKQQGFTEVRLGARILRTETAGLVILSILQSYWGDLN